MLYRVTMSESIDITGVKCATEPLDLLRQRVLYDAAERVARNLRKNHCHVANVHHVVPLAERCTIYYVYDSSRSMS